MQNLLLEKLEKYRSFEYKQLMFSFPLTKKRQGIRPACIVIVEKGTPEIWLNRFGKLEKETVNEGTIVFGLEDAETGLAWDNTKGSTFVLGFPRDYIRIVSYTFGKQRETPSICFHTAFQLPVQGREILETLRLCASCPEFEPVSLCLLRALLNMVWTLVRQKKLAYSSKSEHTWDRIDAYLEEHLASELSRKHLAFMFKMNPCYISALCREKTGRTFNSYVNHLRISYALMNIHSNLSLDELAEQCGFRYTNPLHPAIPEGNRNDSGEISYPVIVTVRRRTEKFLVASAINSRCLFNDWFKSSSRRQQSNIYLRRSPVRFTGRINTLF